MRYPLLAAFGLLLVFGAPGCAGHSGHPAATLQQLAPVDLAVNKSSQLPPLPPSDHFLPQRATADANVTLAGDQTYAAANAAPGAGATLALTAPPQQVAYALYHFSGVPGDTVDQLALDGAALNSGGQVYVALSDYVAQRWTFFAPQPAAQFTTAVTGPAANYVSPGGDTYVVVAVFGGDSVTVGNVSLTYHSRFPVTGRVLDVQGAPVAGAAVSTPLFNQITTTDAAGNFTFPLMLDGSWPVAVTLDGWTFYSNPQLVTVNAANPAPLAFVGRQNGANFVPRDGLAGSDDDPSVARPVDLEAGPENGSLSVTDDPVDNLAVTIHTAGDYYLRFDNPAGDILFPTLQTDTWSNGNYIHNFYVLSGTVCVPVHVASAPETVIATLTASGGGGKYSLSLHAGTLTSLAGMVTDDAAHQIPNQLVQATQLDGAVTTYLTTLAAKSFEDDYREPLSATLVPLQTGYQFAPASLVASLDTGPVLNADFEVDTVAPPDSFEPNNVKNEADLHAVISLPYDSSAEHDPLELDAVRDDTDIYRFKPASGKGLHIRVKPDLLSVPPGLITPYMLDHVLDPVDALINTELDGTLDIRLNTPASGDPYYFMLIVDRWSPFRFGYALSAEEYDIKQLTCHVDFGGAAIDQAQVELRGGPGLEWALELATDQSGNTVAFPAMAGEVLTAELFRYGFDKSRTTQQVVMSSDKVLTFSADPALSSDILEPNTYLPQAQDIALPGTIQATLSPGVDDWDSYRFDLTERKQVQLDLVATSGGGDIMISVEDTNGVSHQTLWFSPGVTRQLFSPPSIGTYVLQVRCPGTSTSYTLSIQTIESYKVTGNLGAGVAFGRVHCVETGAYADADDVTGDYDLGYLPPGSYTIEAYAFQHSPEPAVQTVTITNADAAVDFNLTAAAGDVGEPNNTQAQAYALTPNGVRTSGYSIGVGNDSQDWYTFNATAGQTVQVTVDWACPWLQDAFLDPVKDPANNSLTGGFSQGQGGQQLQFVAPLTGAYAFRVNGGHLDYGITVTVTP